ncbi:DUF6985 domain-containing protein [Gimesia sp.]|uniref:DUF6985 domain-containing protein n=1 Tax=Gimesia sp. TaxID=2024833 RepID=UPI003A9239A5
MDPKKFKKAWSGKLARPPRRSVQSLELHPDDQNILLKAGLPASLFPYFDFQVLKSGDFEHLDQSEAGGGFGAEYHRFRIIGEDTWGMPVCIDVEQAGRVMVLSSDCSQMLLLNSNICKLAASLLAFKELLESSRTDSAINDFMNQINKIDQPAAGQDAYWSRCAIDYFKENEQETDQSLTSSLENPVLGVLSYNDYGQWEVETELFKNMSRCGWNERLVNRFVFPTCNRAGERIDPPADQELVLLAILPSSFHIPIKITFETHKNAPPSEDQERALKYLLSDEKRILKLLVNAVKPYVINSGAWDFVKEELAADLSKLEAILREPAGWLSLIRIRHIHISHVVKSESVVVGFDCAASWDNEHGLGFQLIEGEVIQVGHGTVGWNF